MSGLTAEAIAKIASDAAAAAIAAAMGSATEPDAVTSKVLADAPKAATQVKRATETSEKAASVVRKLDPVYVNVDESLSFVVSPRLYKSSSDIRVNAVTQSARGASVQKSLTLSAIEALAKPETLKRIRAAVAKVDDAAKFTAHPVAAMVASDDAS